MKKSISNILHLNLRRRMILYFLVPTLIILIGTGLTSYFFIRPKYQERTLADLQGTTENIALDYEEQFIRYEHIVRTLSYQVQMNLEQGETENFMAETEGLLQELVKGNTWLYDAWVAFEPGIAYNETAGEYMASYMPLAYMDGGSPVMEYYDYDSDYDGSLYYETSITAEAFVWTQPDYDPVLDFLYRSAAIPIYNNSEIVGVAGLDVDLGFLQIEVVSLAEEVGSSTAFLIDNGLGAIIAHTDEAKTFASSYTEGTFYDVDDLIADDTIDASTMQTVIENMRAGESNYMSYGDNFIVYQEIGAIDSSIAFVYSTNQILASVSQFATLTFSLLASSVVLLGVIVVFVARTVSKPISKISDISKQISQDNYDVDLDIKAKDEIGDLVENFGIMIKAIQKKDEYSRLIIDSTPSPLMHVAPDLKIDDVGKSFLDLSGFPKDEYIGKGVDCFFEDPQEFEAALHEFQTEGHITDREFRLKNNYGKEIFCRFSNTLMFSSEGDDWGHLNTFTDITKDKQLIQDVSTIASEVSSMAHQMSESANQINISIQEITTGAQEVAQGAQHETAQVNDISEAVLSVQDLSQNVVKDTETIAQQSKEGQSMAAEGKQLTDNLLLRINEITVGAEQVSETMGALSEKSKEINKIVDVISGIATETNLLALNAAIEAARAGDAGKGFAVVAEQVRQLAEDSKKAADQINELIKAIQNDVKEAVNATDNTVSSIQEGENAINGTKNKLDDLFNIINATDTNIRKAIDNIEEQDEHIKRVVENIENINSVIEQSSGTAQELSSSTEEMASSLEEMSAATEELNASAERLFDEIKKI